ncbi:MAG TPA: 50S ribosomal protein L1 [Anaerolineae bacterium]|nr:50S ribosomal protein L1 [Anaerolineae bacterium]
MKRHGKNYRAAAQKVDEQKLYTPTEAMALVKDTSFTKFDSTVEVHLRLGVDPRHADQQVRGVVLMPAGVGKTVRVLVFAQGEGARLAQEAGADHVISDDEGLKKIQEGWTDWDISLAMPDMMGKVGRLGKILGVRGLMPNPKAGTIAAKAEDLPRMIKEAKAGRIEFRIDKTANVHVIIGKASFKPDDLLTNFSALMDAVRKAKPAASKGVYLKRVVVTSTMGPGIKVDPNLALALQSAV